MSSPLPGCSFSLTQQKTMIYTNDMIVISTSTRLTAVNPDKCWAMQQAGSLSREVFPTQPGQLTKKPVVILTNSSTASASEVLAGALHGNHR